MQNAAASVVMGLKKRDHITEARKELHWLPVEARLKFKILTLTWKVLNDMGPAYKKKTHSKCENEQNWSTVRWEYCTRSI